MDETTKECATDADKTGEAIPDLENTSAIVRQQKEHPILFSAPMVRALLAGRKSVTRRLSPSWMKVKAGDRLWVRETWTPFEFDDFEKKPSELPHYTRIVYLADQKQKLSGDTYKPSIFMPRWASRILLECEENARIERLQDITEEDARLEGVRQLKDGSGTWVGREGDDREGRHMVTPWFTARQAFTDIWRTLHTKPGERWEDNPEVVRIGKFRRIA